MVGLSYATGLVSLSNEGRDPSYREKRKAGSIRGGTGSGGQSSQHVDAIKI
jgi:hypothetical protein